MKRMRLTADATRVYQFGAVPIGKFPEDGIEEFYRENKLWNTLVELHNKHRGQYEKARCDADEEYASISRSLQELEQQIDAAFDDKRTARMKAGTKDPTHPLIREANDKIQALKAKRSECWQSAKAARLRADSIIDKKALSAAFRRAVNEAQWVKNTDGLNAYTANQVADYFRTARDRAFKEGARLQFHRFDGTGFFFYRFRRSGAKIDGVLFRDLFARDDDDERSFIFIGENSSHRKPRLRLRAKVAGGAKASSRSYALFDLILHRPIPDSAQIQNAKLVRSRTGDRFSYTVSFTVRTAQKADAILEPVAIGVDIGFRQLKDGGIRAAAIASSNRDEPAEYVTVSDEIVKRIQYIDDLKSKLDESATRLGETIKPLLKADNSIPEGHKKYRLVQSIAKMPRNVTLSFEKAYKLGTWVRYEQGILPEKVEQEIRRWWQVNSRSYRELHNLRRKTLLYRKDTYRQIAASLVSRKRPIGVEIIDLRVFAETKDSDNKLGNQARSNRFLVSPSEFLNAIRNAGQREGVPVVDVSARNTSKTCSNCGAVNEKLGAEAEWNCPSCGKIHDRDHNAAVNIARRALEKLGMSPQENKAVA